MEAITMTSLNVSLPEPMKAFIEEEVKRGGYSTPSEFVRELVREAQKRRARDETRVLEALLSDQALTDATDLERARQTLRKGINAKLLEALRGEEATPMTASDWADIRARVLGRKASRAGERNGKRARPKARGSRR
jgi:antitoxin ParD1/3/4